MKKAEHENLMYKIFGFKIIEERTMKKLEFTTSKGSFILVDADSDGMVKLPTNIEYKEIGRVKNITEDQFAEVIDKLEWSDGYFMYYRYDKSVHSFSETWTAKQSFESIVKSLGWYLWENPVKVPMHKSNNIPDMLEYLKAESKTLYNPILLKKI